MDDDESHQSPESRPPTAQRIAHDDPGSLDDSETHPTESSIDELQPHEKPASNATPKLKAESIPSLPPPLPHAAESSFFENPSLLENKHSDSQAELAVREHLQDIESSFYAPPSPILASKNGIDDTYLFDSPSKKPTTRTSPGLPSTIFEAPEQSHVLPKQRSSRTPTPATVVAAGLVLPQIKTEHETADTSATALSLEAFSSSPTAAAAARTVSRALSRTSSGNPETIPETAEHDAEATENQYEPSKDAEDSASGGFTSYLEPKASEPSLLRHMGSDQSLRRLSADAGSTPGFGLKVAKKPKYLRSRNTSQRSSISSLVTDPESDVTVGLGADYALQSGGAVPALGLSRSTSNALSRSISMGSMASGFDDYNDSSGPVFPQLETLNEVSPRRMDEQDDLMRTPKAKRNSRSLAAPTDTVIARHVKNVHVPESLAREYKTKGGLVTPRKPSGFSIADAPGSSTTGTRHGGRNLTLKEQSSTIERLSKENFDLKLKVMFLSDRLDKLSEEGVKEMISENVELKTGLAVLQRDNKVLRRRVKELEKQLKDEDERPGTAKSSLSDDDQSAAFDQEAQEREEELIYLREQMEEYVTEIERLRNENLNKEADRRRMAEALRSFGEKGVERMGESLGRQEEADLWKDLLEQETARREQADEENRRLRDELFRFKQEISASHQQAPGGGLHHGLHHTTNIYNITKKPRDRPSSPNRPSTAFSGDVDPNGTVSAGSTLVEDMRRESEQLRHENAELRREVGAQTSMLTSRNREKERLYQEIEDLKLAQRRGVPAPSTIDSLLDRSASRAGARERSHSRASGGTRMTGAVLDEPEREELENKMAELRDKNNELKLQNQDLQQELSASIEDVEAALEARTQAEELVAVLQEDIDSAMNDLMALQAERDEALNEHATLENEFESLRQEAQDEIDTMEGEANQRALEMERLQLDLNDRTENFDALQEEMRKMSDALVRLEDEQDNKLRRIQELEQELGDANKELEDLEAKLLESNDKAQRLMVQQESSQGEIAFLREEQESDKIRIGDLEAALANTEQGLRDEKDRARELEQRLASERRQREVVANKEKEEVQQFVNELNREASAAKDEARRLRKNLTSREVEATEWKERLIELENNLREALGDLNGTRSSLLKVCLCAKRL